MAIRSKGAWALIRYELYSWIQRLAHMRTRTHTLQGQMAVRSKGTWALIRYDLYSWIQRLAHIVKATNPFRHKYWHSYLAKVKHQTSRPPGA
jgi:hypothetical protein